MKNKKLEKVIEENFEKAIEIVKLNVNEALDSEDFEEIEEILLNVKDVNIKKKILRYDNQVQKINDVYIKLWYIQGFKDGQKFEKCKNLS